MNATKHGLTASELKLENDLDLNLEEYTQSLLEAFKPKGAVEEELVAKITAQMWRLRRVNKTETNCHARWQKQDEDERFPPRTEHMYMRCKTLDTLGRYERSMSRNLHKDIQELKTLQAERKAPLNPSNWTIDQHREAWGRLIKQMGGIPAPKQKPIMIRPVSYDWANQSEPNGDPTDEMNPWFPEECWSHPIPQSGSSLTEGAGGREISSAQETTPAHDPTDTARSAATAQRTSHNAPALEEDAALSTQDSGLPVPEIQNPKPKIENSDEGAAEAMAWLAKYGTAAVAQREAARRNLNGHHKHPAGRPIE